MATFFIVEDGTENIGFTFTCVEANCYCLDYPALKYFLVHAKSPDSLGLPHMHEVKNLDKYRKA